jgi:hypothetical protein
MSSAVNLHVSYRKYLYEMNTINYIYIYIYKDTAIRRQPRFYQSRISRIRGFKFTYCLANRSNGYFVSAVINMCTQNRESVVSVPRYPHIAIPVSNKALVLPNRFLFRNVTPAVNEGLLYQERLLPRCWSYRYCFQGICT